MIQVRCEKCRRIIAEMRPGSAVRIRCHRCGTFTHAGGRGTPT